MQGECKNIADAGEDNAVGRESTIKSFCQQGSFSPSGRVDKRKYSREPVKEIGGESIKKILGRSGTSGERVNKQPGDL